MKKFAIAAALAGAFATPLSAGTALDAQLGRYVDNPAALSSAQKAAAKAMIESELSRSEIERHLDVLTN
ncbi:hypothetical protein GE300_14590 [Rhodobacteraceae bacterium 2CG4]|uniref:Uncharacterized protein n=1 Tax=Halovulum marinum TaxID=2662447 RepID=A0A6L5Z3F9_9RHOB|nr:hypothetical protein [Halovulum marinum]MSU90829.1 hypothetical protein [Halovulum marinum]